MRSAEIHLLAPTRLKWHHAAETFKAFAAMQASSPSDSYRRFVSKLLKLSRSLADRVGKYCSWYEKLPREMDWQSIKYIQDNSEYAELEGHILNFRSQLSELMNSCPACCLSTLKPVRLEIERLSLIRAKPAEKLDLLVLANRDVPKIAGRLSELSQLLEIATEQKPDNQSKDPKIPFRKESKNRIGLIIRAHPGMSQYDLCKEIDQQNNKLPSGKRINPLWKDEDGDCFSSWASAYRWRTNLVKRYLSGIKRHMN